MIDHTHFRMMSMADPYHRELSTRERDALQAHGADCPACKQYHDRLLQFEARLELALRVLISQRAAPMTGPKRGGPWRNGEPMLALAASLLLGLVIVSGSWIATTHSSLAADVVSHVAAESVTATSVARIGSSFNPDGSARISGRDCSYRRTWKPRGSVSSIAWVLGRPPNLGSVTKVASHRPRPTRLPK